MYVFFLGCLFVIVIPLAEGVLLALLLREMHNRHPLPLGGVIETPERYRIRTARLAAERAKTLEKKKIPVKTPDSTSPDPIGIESAVGSTEESLPASSEVNVFDEAARVPEGLPISEVLDLMGTESPSSMPVDFEHLIENSTRSEVDLPPEIRDINDDMDIDDLDALAAALPRDKIDFSQELDLDSVVSQPISSTAKEVLGEHFDFATLESPSSVKLPVAKDQENILVEIPMNIQEDGAGTVQVLSPFLPEVLTQWSDFTTSQTIVPTFSENWIQETSSTDEPTGEDVEKFCFTAESTPMLVRKKKSS